MNERYSEAQSRAVAQKLLTLFSPHPDRATVVGLSGELGAGKTTLTQAIAAELGVETALQSPTFVIAKFYPTPRGDFSELIHIDAYRIDADSELGPIGWHDILARPNTLVIIEWPERIEGALPQYTQRFIIDHDGQARAIRHA